VNPSYASFSLKDPRDLHFAVRALLGPSESAPDACAALSSRFPPAPTVAELVEVVFAEHCPAAGFPADRDRAVSLLAAYFAIDPPVEPDPLA
jgi:hypothetical protein